jgi:hypothetical protein
MRTSVTSREEESLHEGQQFPTKLLDCTHCGEEPLCKNME